MDYEKNEAVLKLNLLARKLKTSYEDFDTEITESDYKTTVDLFNILGIDLNKEIYEFNEHTQVSLYKSHIENVLNDRYNITIDLKNITLDLLYNLKSEHPEDKSFIDGCVKKYFDLRFWNDYDFILFYDNEDLDEDVLNNDDLRTVILHTIEQFRKAV